MESYGENQVVVLMAEWEKFENIARTAIEAEVHCPLNKGNVSIKGKNKSFDLVNKDKKIVGDIKFYSMPESGSPSAKFSTLNEYAWLMQKLNGWRKIFVIGVNEELIETYIKRFDKWLGDIEIYHCSIDGKLTRKR
ncbi:MAG: hypothetical protein QXN16_02235 [Candidatus Micrarchaeaceae archaeon]